MSIKVMTWVWENSKQKGSSLLMLLAIADRCDDYGVCYPGHKRLAEKARISTNSVSKHINALEKAGEVSVIVHGGIKTTHGKTNKYYLKAYRDSLGLITKDGNRDEYVRHDGKLGNEKHGALKPTPQDTLEFTPHEALKPTPYPLVDTSVDTKEETLPPAKNADGAVASDNDLSANDNTLIGPVPLCTVCNENYEAHYVGVDASNVGTYVCTPCYESPNVHTCTNCGHYRMHSGGDMQITCDDCMLPDGSGWKMAEETAARLVDECQSAGCILQRDNPLACLDCEGYGLTDKEAQCLRKLPFSETGQQFASNKDNIEPLKNMEFLEVNQNGQYSITDLGRKVLAIHDTKPSCQGNELSENIEQLTAEQAAATGFGMFICSKCARRLSLETDGWKDTVADPQLCNDCFESQQTTIEIDEPVSAKKPCKHCGKPASDILCVECHETIEDTYRLPMMTDEACEVYQSLEEKPKAKKPRKQKQTPEEKQIKDNMFEAVKFTWQLNDSAAWKIVKYQKFMLGIIKDSKADKRYGDDFKNCQLALDAESGIRPATAHEVVAFGHWYRVNFDGVSFPERATTLLNQFQAFLGSDEYDKRMNQAAGTIRNKIPKIVIAGISSEPVPETTITEPQIEDEEIMVLTQEQLDEIDTLMASIGTGGVKDNG